MVQNNDDCIVNIKNELAALGLLYLWNEARLNTELSYKLIDIRLLDVTKQKLMDDIKTATKVYLYQHLIDSVCLQ